MPSAFISCHACGKPVYTGARHCPNCRAPTSWRGHLRRHVFAVSIVVIAVIAVVYVALD